MKPNAIREHQSKSFSRGQSAEGGVALKEEAKRVLEGALTNSSDLKDCLKVKLLRIAFTEVQISVINKILF